MKYYGDIYTVSIRGDKNEVIRMLNAAICNVGSGNVISENDDVETIILKLKDDDGKHLLRLSIIDLMDEKCLRDNVIQEKKAAFEKKVDNYRDIIDGKVDFESEDDAEYARYKAEDALENMFDGRFRNITGVEMFDEIMEVWMEYYVGEEPMSYPDWAGWDDLCRLYGCKVVIDDVEYLNAKFHAFCGTVIYELEDGSVKKTLVNPQLPVRDYVDAMNSLVKMDSTRYRETKIWDMEAKIAVLQAELSREQLFVALENLDKTNGHLQVPEGVTAVSDVTWKYNKKIRSISIPASVSSINKHAISTSNIQTIEISPDNPYFCSVNNCILDKEKKTLLVGCSGSVIPDGITEIEESAFSDCIGLESVTIPSSVTKIGNNAFIDCTGLHELVIEEGLQKIGGFAFTRCTSLSKVALPKSLEYIYGSAFAGCSSLTNVTLPGNLKFCPEGVFQDTPYASAVPQVVIKGERN